ncbi:MAG TPA: substrate-binding domain-containing protein [Streptosporangiaceae bacterium]|jgi:putative molybdopterin biosynthesis protein
MVDGPGTAGTGLRMARQARGFSQQQLAGMAGVSRQAVSAVESGHSDPSLRVALALAQALGMSVEQLFGPGEPTAPVTAVSVAPLAGRGSGAGPGAERPVAERVMLVPVGDRFVALPLRGDAGAGLGFLPAGGLAVRRSRPAPAGPTEATEMPRGADGRPEPAANASAAFEEIAVRPIGPPRPTVVVAGCDPALPLLAAPLQLLDPPVAFAWWPCGSGEALRLARAGLVHAAGVHTQTGDGGDGAGLPDGAEVVGFTAWREGLAVRPELRAVVTGLDAIARRGLRIVNREPGAEARRLLDRERARLHLDPADLIGYDTEAAGHLQVASAVVAGLADAGVASEPAARAYGLAFVPLARERFNLVIPAEHTASREAQALLKVLTSPWLLAQLASIPGYDLSTCGERFS